jgi:hypothetical protein
MITIIENVAGLFVFSLLVAPIVMLTILLLRTRKPKQNPQQHVKLEELEQNDYTIVDDVNKAFGDVNNALNEIGSTLESFNERLEEIEQKMDREENTVKGFSDKIK